MNAQSAADRPVASIVTVSDYKAGDAEAWDALRLTLQGLARQDYREPVEFLLVEATEARQEIPPDLLQSLPGLKVVRAPGTTSYDLKNAGAHAAASDFVVLLDADCAPHPNWWRSIIEHRQRHPQAAVISGRTKYKGQGLLPRVFALLDRSYVDCGEPGGRHDGRHREPARHPAEPLARGIE
jgi:cellulose synthase/poly-beta-1,6-N-acetylglucosamine synthase-like glycosyltransferase